ncbi:DUF7365 family protein [Staphylococcus succinus]|uniref:DUF7365 family protein n=1 Tax=Staphylococcus succinus TaxID=61015 RepID=UPI000935F9DA|nr:hypothetical protein [Staphylococcus succinus]
MNENEILNWLLFTVVPVSITIGTFVFKIGKDKRDNENRITRIESKVDQHDSTISVLNTIIEKQREDTSAIRQVSTQIETLTKRFDNFEKRFYNSQGHK